MLRRSPILAFVGASVAVRTASLIDAAHLQPAFVSAAGRRRLHHHASSPPPPSLLRRHARYGPPEEPLTSDTSEEDFWAGQEEWERKDEVRVAAQRVEFTELLDEVINADDPDHLPGIVTRRVELLLGMRGYEGVALIEAALDEARAADDEGRIGAVTAAADYILSFTEEFVGQAAKIDDGNKKLLGKIVSAIAVPWDGHGDRPGRADEADLDDLLEREKDSFTPGFLRHLEGECSRIMSAPKVSPESAKLLQTMRLIQARVVEELGKDLGEGAQVLGQLLGYDDRAERLAVLDAGLTVRGVEFAEDLASLTQEALEEFPKILGGADPGLVRIVEEIDGRIRQYVDSSRSFQ